MATTETRNQQVAREITDAIVAAYEEGAFDALKRSLTPDFVCHPGGGARLDTEAYLARIEATREAFPDFRKDVESLLVDGDEVAVHYRWGGTHEGEFAGVEATGEEVEVTSLTLMRLDDGKLAELFIYGDSASLMDQLNG